jgi:ubiquinone/menaquinone biosynthesis C-methylase UbiE
MNGRSGFIFELGYTLSQGLRSSRYISQSIFGTIVLGRRPSPDQIEQLPPHTELLKGLWEILRQDARQIRSGVYKAPKRWVESPAQFAKSSFRVIRDLTRVKRREQTGQVVDLPEHTGLPGLPKYYLQNFHFQTDGWLSEESADLYDHQVEVTFGGTAAAMRRQALPPLVNYLREKGLLGKASELQMLDLASGTGSLAVDIKHNFPDLHLTLSDLSPFYLKKARKNLANFSRTDFVEANAENLPFRDAHFDVVVCVYLFHELPRRVRALVMNEVHRVLKPGGLFIFVDSIQLGDNPHFDGSLRHFPVHHHEPYYMDYVSRPLSDFVPDAKWSLRETQLAFLSKVAAYEKLPSP